MAGSKKPKGLLFCRPYLVPDFRTNFSPLADRFDFEVLTDGRCPGENDTREAFYRHLKAGTEPQELTDEEVEDCIARCRLLRNIERMEALARIGAVSAAFTEWLDRLSPDFVATHLVDEHMLHILAMLCRKRGIPFLAYCASYFPGYVQFYRDERGRPLTFRDASLEEADAIIATITQKSFRQDYSHKSSYSWRYHAFRVARYYTKRVAFTLRGLLERDPMQLHYAVIPYLAERRSVFDYPSARLFHNDWQDRLNAQSQETIFFPLGYFPEATADYWISNKAILQYEATVLDILTTLSSRFCVVVKEHPHMMGIRSRGFYRKLRALPGVVMVPPVEFSAQLMARCQAVIIGSGSGGVEATLAGTPIFTFCETSYWFKPSRASRLDLSDIVGWPRTVAEGISLFQPLNDREKREFISTCLAGAAPSRPGGGIWKCVDVESLKAAIDLVLSRSEAANGLVKGK